MELLWNDDPEELLLELGFGCDEPDLSGRIPARFINYQSQARGINLQVFLEAQKSRIDLENPDVSNRFRQLEVLQEVSVAFSSLAGPLKGRKDLSPEARERRRRMGMLFRRASKKSLSQLHGPGPQEPAVAPSPDPPATGTPPHPPLSRDERKVLSKRVRLQDTVGLRPFVEEEGDTEAENMDRTDPGTNQSSDEPRGTPRERFRDRVFQSKKSVQMRESFELEELGSFDEGGVAGQDPAGTPFVRGLIRVNSCQSDSSGFQEDPTLPTLPPDPSPAPHLLKALSALSGGSTDGHCSDLSPLTSDRSTSAADHLTTLTQSLMAGHTVSPESEERPAEGVVSPESEERPAEGVVSPESEKRPAEGAVSPESEERPAEGVVSPESEKRPAEGVVSPESAVNGHMSPPDASGLLQDTGVINASVQNYPQKETGMEEKTVYFVSSARNDHWPKSVLTTDLDDFPFPRTQRSVFEEQVPLKKKKPIVVTHFFHQQDVTMISEAEPDDFPVGLQVRSVGSITARPRSQSEEVYLETEIDWQDLMEDLENRPNEDPQHVPGVVKAEPGLEMPTPKVSELIEIESLNQVFETCLDAFEVETVDVEAFFEELNSYGRVYWAEPVYVGDLSSRSVSFEEIHDFQEDFELAMQSDDALNNKRNMTTISSFSKSLSSLEDAPTIHSISGQMRSASSSHIVHRKDIPFTDRPKQGLLTRRLKLDTSNPFRAVQSWTNLHIQNVSKAMVRKVSNSAGGNLNRPSESARGNLNGPSEGARGNLNGPSEGARGNLNGPSEGARGNLNGPSEGARGNLNGPSEGARGNLNGPSESARGNLNGPSESARGNLNGPSEGARGNLNGPSEGAKGNLNGPSDGARGNLNGPSEGAKGNLNGPSEGARGNLNGPSESARGNLNGPSGGTSGNLTGPPGSSGRNLNGPSGSSWPMHPALAPEWQSDDCLHKASRGELVSLDTGLWAEDEEVDRVVGPLGRPDCTCGHVCDHCKRDNHNMLSQRDLEGLPLNLQQFWSMLCLIEEEVSEQQAAVYSALSLQDRQCLEELLQLRRAVRQETLELQLQLSELMHRHDPSLAASMQRLLDEQSFLCSQLRLSIPRPLAPLSEPVQRMTVATQCSPQPDPLQGPSPMQLQTGPSHPLQSGSSHQRLGQGCAPAKDKRPLAGFLHRLKDSVRH